MEIPPFEEHLEDVLSSSSSDEEFDASYLKNLASLQGMILEDESDADGDLSLAFNYDQMAKEEGLEHLIKAVPLDARLELLGTVDGFVERLLIVRPADVEKVVDLDTLVILEDRRVLGKVFEVFGPVESPFLSVLCHVEHLDQSFTGTAVYYLPDQASIVQKAELLAQKCTDADGLGGPEEFSDDEAERAAKRERKPKRPVGDLEPGEIDE